MLIENKGIKIKSFYIPPFILREGEIVVIHLSNDQNAYEIETFLKDIFCGKKKNENVIVYKSLTFVKYIIEPKFRHIFCPITVEEYLKKNSKLDNPFAEKIYEIDWINKKTKVNTLPGNPRKLLSLYSTLSYTNNIIFDISGQDKQGAKETYTIVKEVLKKGGSAILLDRFGDLKNDCDIYVELQQIK